MLKKFIYLLFLIPCVCWAQKNIVLVVPFAAGGPTDSVARILQQSLIEELGKPVVIEYRPGAGGDIGSAYVANWSRDETVLLLQSTAFATNQALGTPTWNRSALVPLGYLGTVSMMLVVGNKSKLTEFAEWRQLSPDKTISWGSAGVGSISHIYGELFKSKLQKNLLHVPYKGQSQSMSDLIAGVIDSAFVFSNTAEPFVKNQQVVAVAVGSANRVASLPNVPTFRELGVTGMDYYNWFILLTNQNTSIKERETIQKVLSKILSRPGTIKTFQKSGLDVNYRNIDQSFVLKEVHRYQELIKTINLKVDQ